MTEKDYVKERLAQVKMLIAGVVGSMFAFELYFIQNPGTNPILLIGVAIAQCIFLLHLGKGWSKLLEELKDLP
jgi:hypothetical protein